MAFKVNWSEVGQQLTNVDYRLFVPVLILFILHNVFRALRWRFLLSRGSEIRLINLFDALMLGNLSTFILPLRAGEFVRPYVLSLKSPVPFATGFVSVVIERFFDLAAVLLSFGVLVVSIPDIPSEVYQGAGALTVLAVGILLVMGIGSFAPRIVTVPGEWVIGYLPSKIAAPLNKFMHDFLEGTRVLKNFSTLLKVVILTALVWGSNYVIFYLYVALVNVPPTPELAVAVAVVLALAVAAPSMPGFIGVYQVGCIWGFALFSHSKEVAITFSIVTHLFNYLVFLAYGGFVLVKNNLSLSDLKNRPVE